MNASQINTALIQGTFTNEELLSIIDAVKFARTKLASQNKRSLTVGVKVSFVNSRNGNTYVGTVRKISIKNVVVDTPQGAWNVPANMLELA
jgi:hypothetical protein